VLGMSDALIEILAGVVMSSHHDQDTCIT
jgi:hypothetical protein